MVGTIIRFNDDPNCDRRVKRVARYRSFDEMMSKEDPTKINPRRTASEQLSDIKRIYPPHKERLGVVVFELETV
jgi:ASC-1-like (ASCH) protein